MSRAAYRLRPINFNTFVHVFTRHMILSYRNLSGIMNTIMFFVLTIIFFRIGVGPENIPLSVKVGIIFSCLLLAMILSSSHILSDDYEDGTLEQLYMTGVLFEIVILSKYLAHSMLYALLFCIALPLALLMLDINYDCWWVMLFAGILSVFASILIIMFAVSLLLGNHAGMLIAVIVFPLILPVLIIATLSIQNTAYLWVLVALLLAMIPVFIFGVKYAVLYAIQDT